MFPRLGSTLFNWGTPIKMKVIKKVAVDFENVEQVKQIPTVEVVIQPMSPRKVERKPEGERSWKWYEGWSQDSIELDTVIQDPSGVEFRVQWVTDWSDAGFTHCELVQQPAGTV